MYTIETIKYGISGAGVYDTPDQTKAIHKTSTLKEARAYLRASLKFGFKRVHGNYINNSEGLELHTNF